MAITITQLHTTNPGPNVRIYSVTALAADGGAPVTLAHGLVWTPDWYFLECTDGSDIQYVGLYRAQVNSTLVSIDKNVVALSGGALRLTIGKSYNSRY